MELPGTAYSLVRLLGKGGSGDVFLGTHEPLGKQVAIKLLHRDGLDRLQAEARLLARIQHPALVGVFDLGTTSDGRPFLVMEYVEGETVRGPLPHARACELVAQVLDGLAVAHAHGIVHRDIKASNVIMGKDGRPRIVDFGSATGRASASTDLYAAGCLLLELLTGTPPLPDASPASLSNPELEAFLAQVFAKDPAERPTSAEAMAEELRRMTRGAPPAAPTRRGSTNVREPMTAFLGRERELVALGEMFDGGDRIVTLTGPGGSGKTRLAKRHATAHVADYAAGTWFVSLAEARDAADAVALVGRVLGVSLQGGKDAESAIAQLGRSLASMGRLLLVLDNCEQAAADVARLVGQWLDAAPEATFLATSRERLGVTGERAYDVLPLAEAEAVKLFVERARLVRPDYVEETWVSKIVNALDRIPLAIELAAARMALMSAQELLDRLGSRFAVLSTQSRDAPAHQRTLHGTIDWSYRLLEPKEQLALRQCSVFRGGFTLEAAEAIVSVGAPVVEVIQRLRDKSLVYAQPSRDFPSELRLGLYESIRDYALLVLEAVEGEATGGRHAAYYLSKGAEWADRATRGSPEHLRRLSLEAENLKAVHAHALGKNPRVALSSADILHALFSRCAPLSTALALASSTLESEGILAEPAMVATVLYNRANVWRLLGSSSMLRSDVERLLELAPHGPVCEAQARIRLAESEAFVGGSAETRAALAEAAVAAARATGDPRWQRRALTQLGAAQINDGRREQARQTFLEIIELAEGDDDAESAASARGNLGVVLMDLGELDRAERSFEEAISALRTMGYSRAENLHRYNLALLRQERGDYEQAERGYREAIANEADSGFIRTISLGALGALLASRGEIEEATRVLDTAEAAIRTTGDTYSALVSTHRGQLDLALARRRAQQGDEVAAGAHRAVAWRRLSEAAAAAELSDDVRTARRWLERALLLDTSGGYPTDAWIVASDGGWFRPPRGWRVSIESRLKARQVLCALLRARAQDRALSLDEVLAAGWPGEKMQRRAAEARVYNIIKMLRNAGMRDLIVSTEAGYLMDPAQTVVSSAPAGTSLRARRHVV